MSCQFYRVCKSREEAEGLLEAIAEKLGERGLCRLYDLSSGRPAGILFNATYNHDETGEPEGDVYARIRESNVAGKFQLTIRSAHRGYHERIRATLNRRAYRIQWPLRAA